MTMTKPTSEQVTFTAAGSGATLRNLVDKVREVVSVKDFGAQGDNISDDTASIQAAMNHATANNVELVFPAGNYLVTSPLSWTGRLVMRGAPRNGTNSSPPGTSIVTLRAMTPGMQAVILGPSTPAGGSATVQSVFDGVNLECNGYADYGIYGYTYLARFSRFRVSNAKVAGLRIGMIVNVFEDLLLQGGTGDGLVIEHASSYGSNHTTIRNVSCLLLTGFGIVVNGPTFSSSSNALYGITIDSCLMEDCRKGGIFLTAGIEAFKIDRCYFEGNAADGYTFTSPTSHLVKSDIIVNGENATTIGDRQPCYGSITNCVTSTNGTSFVFASAFADGVIEANTGRAPVTSSLPVCQFFGTPSVQTRFTDGKPMRLRIGANTRFGNFISVNPFANTAINIAVEGSDSERFSDTTVLGSSQVNIAERDLNAWTTLSGSTGSFVRSSVAFPFNADVPVWEIDYAAGLTTTSVFGFSINAANYPQLHGKPMLFAVWVKAPFVTTTANGYVNLVANSASTDVTFRNWNSFGWVRKMAFFIMPTSGTINFGIQAQAAGSASNTPAVATPAGTVQVATPVLCQYGANFPQLWGEYGNQTQFRGTAAPTAGTWKRGDIVWNTTPSAAGDPGWMCVTAGTPGTWKAMANIDA